MQRKKTRREQVRAITLTIMGICACLVIWHLPIKWPQVLIYNHTASVPIGWYLMIPAGNPADGDIVGFDAPENVASLAVERGWAKSSDVMLKRIGAMSGECYELDAERGFYVGGRYLGQALAQDGYGRALPQLSDGQYIVEDGRFLPVAENPLSFDGRYYGTVPLNSIRFKAIKLNPFS